MVIGGGVSGLTCARELMRRHVPAVVLERARGVGGRCATRRIEGQSVDHGVPFLHARTGEFGEELNELDPAGKIPGWPLRLRGARLACQPDAFRPGNRRLARVAGVNEFAKHLARGVDVRLGAEVTAIEARGAALTIAVRDGAPWHAPIVVVAGSVDQSLRLIEPLVSPWPDADEPLAAMRAVTAISAATVIAGYALDTADPGFDVWYPVETTMIHTLSHDSTKRRDPRFRVLVIQGRPRFSAEAAGRDAAEWTRDLLWETGELLGAWATRPRWTQSHRWESARVRERDIFGASATFESAAGARVGVVGDSFAPHAGVEGAYLSGIAMGERIATLPGIRAGVRAR